MWLEDDTKLMVVARWLYVAAIAIGSFVAMLWVAV
jgi:hypothetical protein